MTLNNRTDRSSNLLRRAAFTLMEMLVVVAIIVVLAGVGGAYLIGQLNQSKISAAKMQAYEVSKQVEVYLVDNGEYPPTLQALLQRTANGKGPYLKNVDNIKDPWGREFQYDPNGSINSQKGATVTTPDVYCTAPDGTLVGNFK